MDLGWIWMFTAFVYFNFGILGTNHEISQEEQTL